MNKTLTQMQSHRIRNLHRLSDIKDANDSMDALEADVKKALTEVLKQHGLRLGETTVTLNLGTMPSLYNGKSAPNGYLSAALIVE